MAKTTPVEPAWETEEAIAEALDVSHNVARNVVKLLEEGATIPFIARYRKEMTGGMEADKLRELSSLLDELKAVKAKIKSVYNAIESMGKMHAALGQALRRSRSLTEVEHLYAPFKPGHKGSLAERARKLGLESPANQILEGKSVTFSHFVKQGTKGLDKLHDVETGIQHILADTISKDKDVMAEMRTLCDSPQVRLESSESRGKKEDKPSDTHKFEQYFDFSIPVKYAKSHQILAVNRGEDKKILAVKVTIPDTIKRRVMGYCTYRFVKNWLPDTMKSLMTKSISDAYDRLLQPQMSRHIRSELTKKAEKDSISVFASNLKRLLLTPPVRGKMVLGIDPGFKNGCKTAVVSATGVIQTTQVLYFFDHKSNKNVERRKVVELVKTHRCEMIAIGNGSACRQTEQFIADMIKNRDFGKQDIMYCIVDESGASIYSVSDEAKRELPDLDPTLRGAVSIARRLQDPLAELVKIEPKHIGVGMYQHDIAEGKLKTSLDSVVEECVSFVGVDINTGSECLLRRIAGLNATKAKKVLEWREKNGAFVNREQLLGIKGFGQKGFEQCAGFIRVINDFSNQDMREDVKDEDPEAGPSKGRKRKGGPTKTTAKKKKTDISSTPNPLDMTAIHPESYHIGTRFISDIKLDPCNIGHHDFQNAVKKYMTSTNVEELATKYDTGVPTISLITDALSQSIFNDIRDQYDKPLFKREVLSIQELKPHQKLTGRVTNVTHFGAFVDIGVGESGLIHTSQMGGGLEGRQGLELGDNVNVEVKNVDLAKKRIGLRLLGFTR